MFDYQIKSNQTIIEPEEILVKFDYHQSSHLSHKAWNIHTPFSSRFLGLWLQILNSMTHFQVSKWHKQYKQDKNSLDQKNIDFWGCECYMPCVIDGRIDGSLIYVRCQMCAVYTIIPAILHTRHKTPFSSSFFGFVTSNLKSSNSSSGF